MLGRIASVGSKAVKVATCAALITVGAAGVQFYEGGRERVVNVFGPALEKTRDVSAKASARAESVWDKVESDPEKYIGILIAVLTFVASMVAVRSRKKSVHESLVAALVPAEPVSPVIQALQNKELAYKLRAELRALDARASHFRTDIERAEKILAQKTKDKSDAETLLDTAEKEYEDAAESLRSYLSERDEHVGKRAEIQAEIERLEAAV